MGLQKSSWGLTFWGYAYICNRKFPIGTSERPSVRTYLQDGHAEVPNDPLPLQTYSVNLKTSFLTPLQQAILTLT